MTEKKLTKMPGARQGILMLTLLALLSPGLFSQSISFDNLYIQGVLGTKFSPDALALKDKPVEMTGWMAPPLKVVGKFFVLSRTPVSLCPFCQSDADWPADIVVVYLDRPTTFIQKNRPLLVKGKLELGSYTDPDTGFVSLVRITGASWTVQ